MNWTKWHFEQVLEANGGFYGNSVTIATHCRISKIGS